MKRLSIVKGDIVKMKLTGSDGARMSCEVIE